MLPLDGITVISVEQAVAAPFATRQLADLGARVIKVERPGTGDFARGYDETVRGMSSHFVWLNRSKESIALDLKRPEDAAVLRRLVDRADVFVQNLAPGAAGRLGLDAATLTGANPRLVVCAISGYGTGGPYTDQKAYDLLVQCESGAMSLTGTPEAPAKVGIPVADIAAAMYAYSGILTALYERERTGRGSAFEVSMLEALGEWMGYPGYFTRYGGAQPPRSGAEHAAIAPYGPYATRDGVRVFLGVQNEREWEDFCARVLDAPQLATDPRFARNSLRVENRDALRTRIEERFAALSAVEAERRLESARIAHARLRDVTEFADHPQLAARNRWRTVDSPVGPLDALLPPVTVAGREPRMDRVPALDEDRERILAGLDATATGLQRIRT
ncbi:CoA transferase [Streptomyces scopuliridis]|uniref:CoA transferase n=1 Tax=Streptomyces scopuliridis TaxID=452529 RepID=A0ACD4ZUW3_9ACTN|nr:CaiB/BaiF CoA-transferase family protein [Streptomyces scopuliridis]WSB37356.1 CoA transferase [Streptomyces scopuliridis]WSC01971.1 CoA transferase [Streptomyces scopuliridis]WSC04492.1 CoA transferase [Streptomyces scopuliridis]